MEMELVRNNHYFKETYISWKQVYNAQIEMEIEQVNLDDNGSKMN